MESQKNTRGSDGIADALVSSVERELSRVGYASRTIELYMRTCGRFTSWLSRMPETSSTVSFESTERFLEEHLPNCRCHPR